MSLSTAPRRADYVRNRTALLAAARDVFGEHGEDASVDEIARRAGIAKGTFFRHFSSKENLIQELVADRLVTLGDVAHEINTTREPGWSTLRLMIERFFEQTADDRLLLDFVERREGLNPSHEIMRARDTLASEVDRAVAGASERGEIRPDVVGPDFPKIMFMVARATAAYRATEPLLGRRYLRLFLDGIRAAHRDEDGA
jgi:AcrR family transcriptional regulator